MRNAHHLFAWMDERESIRQRRINGDPQPWTDDAILSRYRFTNVMREYDRYSIWVQREITDRYVEDPLLPARLNIARHFGRADTMEAIMAMRGWASLDVDSLVREIGAYIHDPSVTTRDGSRVGRKIWHSAYMIWPGPYGPDGYPEKHEWVLRGVVDRMCDLISPMDPPTLKGTVERLMAIPGMGGFMSYELACDLRWAPGWLDQAPDIYSWANAGPGAIRGLKTVYGDKPRNQTVANDWMASLLRNAWDWPWEVKWPRKLEMRDIEHSLCEFDKYVRAAFGDYNGRKYDA